MIAGHSINRRQVHTPMV